jgi:hypothetical protein
MIAAGLLSGVLPGAAMALFGSVIETPQVLASGRWQGTSKPGSALFSG